MESALELSRADNLPTRITIVRKDDALANNKTWRKGMHYEGSKF